MGKKSNKKKNDYIKKIENQAKSSEKKGEIKYEPSPDVTLTAYTFFAMLTIVASAVATALGAILLVKPINYGMDLLYGKDVEEGLLETLAQAWFEGETKQKIMLTVSVIIMAVVAISALVVMIRAMVPEKKPMPIITWINLILSIASTVLFVLATKSIFDICTEMEPTFTYVELIKNYKFNIYAGAIIAYAVNIVLTVTNIVGNNMGLSRYKKNGKAY
ncbi:MAG: hypothetical protein E7258_02775 [Lachnospiraceae bacterium]|nr:hypothetical protein [Lachnospiraceae bacterium]